MAKKDVTNHPGMITPVGIASNVYLLEKDTEYGDTYKIQLLLDKKDIGPGRLDWGKQEVSGAAWVKALQALAKSVGAADKIHTEGFHIKDGDKPNSAGKTHESLKGKLLVNMKSGFKPKCVDSNNNELPRSVKIERGDTVRCLVVPSSGTAPKGGTYMSLYVNTVMLMDKTASDGVDWGNEDGYVIPEDQHEADWGGDDSDDSDF